MWIWLLCRNAETFGVCGSVILEVYIQTHYLMNVELRFFCLNQININSWPPNCFYRYYFYQQSITNEQKCKWQICAAYIFPSIHILVIWFEIGKQLWGSLCLWCYSSSVIYVSTHFIIFLNLFILKFKRHLALFKLVVTVNTHVWKCLSVEKSWLGFSVVCRATQPAGWWTEKENMSENVTEITIAWLASLSPSVAKVKDSILK